MKQIAIFSSGSGSNAENIIKYFSDSDVARVVTVFCNNPKAGVIDRTHKLGVRCLVFDNHQLEDGYVLGKLHDCKTDLIVLAGFLKKIPSSILDDFEDRVINIHPSLLPDYGGEGMYGIHIHRAVVENEEEETGITIHHVSDDYDEGEIIFQEPVEIDFEDTPEDVQYKVQQLEYKHYPEVIEYLLRDL
ncbi:MAG: phosphoribosylglycinamide formyltransferase [Owenweeksia sp.]